MTHAITPTATAEGLAERLVAWLTDLASTYQPLVDSSIDAVRAGGGIDVAESVVNDIEHICRAVDEHLEVFGMDVGGSYSTLGQMLRTIVEPSLLEDELDARNPDFESPSSRWMPRIDIDQRLDAVEERLEVLQVLADRLEVIIVNRYKEAQS